MKDVSECKNEFIIFGVMKVKVTFAPKNLCRMKFLSRLWLNRCNFFSVSSHVTPFAEVLFDYSTRLGLHYKFLLWRSSRHGSFCNAS